VVQVSGTNYVELGSPIRLICNATGRYRAPADVNWYRQGQMIESNSVAGVAVSKKTTQRVLMSMLVIDSSQITDAGEYSCQVSSGDAASIDVHILNGQFHRAFCLHLFDCFCLRLSLLLHISKNCSY